MPEYLDEIRDFFSAAGMCARDFEFELRLLKNCPKRETFCLMHIVPWPVCSVCLYLRGLFGIVLSRGPIQYLTIF